MPEIRAKNGWQAWRALAQAWCRRYTTSLKLQKTDYHSAQKGKQNLVAIGGGAEGSGDSRVLDANRLLIIAAVGKANTVLDLVVLLLQQLPGALLCVPVFACELGDASVVGGALAGTLDAAGGDDARRAGLGLLLDVHEPHHSGFLDTLGDAILIARAGALGPPKNKGGGACAVHLEHALLGVADSPLEGLLAVLVHVTKVLGRRPLRHTELEVQGGDARTVGRAAERAGRLGALDAVGAGRAGGGLILHDDGSRHVVICLGQDRSHRPHGVDRGGLRRLAQTLAERHRWPGGRRCGRRAVRDEGRAEGRDGRGDRDGADEAEHVESWVWETWKSENVLRRGEDGGWERKGARAQQRFVTMN